ncbi:MAG: hypothetical protein NVV73_01610 [Cellvibrionaceae bacterium]|nr:hypothetical protein [Cellvibrionaceae bacterium]
MISVWPKFYPETANYRELNAKGYMFNKNIEDRNYDWIGPGYLNTFYDAFAPEAREIFWRQMDKKLNSYGFDAWWLDAVEPDIHSNLSFSRRKDLMTPNALGTGAEYFNAYALPHAESVYQGDRRSDPDKRVFYSDPLRFWRYSTHRLGHLEWRYSVALVGSERTNCRGCGCGFIRGSQLDV